MKKSKALRNFIIILVALILIFVIGKKVGWWGKKPITIVDIGTVTKQTIVETVSATGKIQPHNEVKISSDISGEIIELRVKEGDLVKKGDLLCRIKPDQYQRGVERANANVNTARAQIENSRAQYQQILAQLEKSKTIFNRQKKLFEQNAISQAEFENISSEYESIKAQLDGARHSIESAKFSLSSSIATQKEAQDQLNKTSIYSPMSGSVSKMNKLLGERVVGTIQMEGSEIMRISDLNEMEVQVEVNENDVVRIHNGDSADIEVDALRGQIFKGTIIEIASSSANVVTASLDQATNYVVKIHINKSSYEKLINKNLRQVTPFRPGMSATVSVQTKIVRNALSVPILAVTVRGDDGKRDSSTSGIKKDYEVIFVLTKDNVAKQRIVTTGIQDDSYMQIVEGVKENEIVISGPFNLVSKTLKDGDKVESRKIETKEKNAKKI